MVASLLRKIRDLEKVAKQIRSDAVTVAEARCLFDAVIQMHPFTKVQLEARAAMFAEPTFEGVALKNQNKQEDLKTPTGQSVGSHLLKEEIDFDREETV